MSSEEQKWFAKLETLLGQPNNAISIARLCRACAARYPEVYWDRWLPHIQRARYMVRSLRELVIFHGLMPLELLTVEPPEHPPDRRYVLEFWNHEGHNSRDITNLTPGTLILITSAREGQKSDLVIGAPIGEREVRWLKFMIADPHVLRDHAVMRIGNHGATGVMLARGAMASFVSSSEQMSNDGLAIDFSTVPESSYTEENWPLCAGYLRFGMSEFHQREQEKRPPEGDSIDHCVYVPVPRPRKRPDDETLPGPWKPPATMRETLSNLGRLSAEPLGIEATKEIFHSKKGEN